MILRALPQAALLLVLAFLPAIGQAIYFRGQVPWQSRLTSGEMVDVDLARSWGESAIWIDARPDNEFEAGHIPGAVLLNEDRWNDLLPQFLAQWSAEKKIVVYCSAASCNLAEDVARRLRNELKLPNDIRVLSGGWEKWQSKNR